MELGTAIKFQRKPGDVADGVVLAQEFTAEGDLPKLHIVYLNPDKVLQLSGASWYLAFDHAWSVPHLESDEGDAASYGWVEAPSAEAFLQLRRANSILRAQLAVASRPAIPVELPTSNPAPVQPEGEDSSLPSATDLDAVAAEEKAKAETSKTKAGKKSWATATTKQ